MERLYLRFTLTPEVGLGLHDGGRDYCIGWRLARPDDGESFAFSFKALTSVRQDLVGGRGWTGSAYGVRTA